MRHGRNRFERNMFIGDQRVKSDPHADRQTDRHFFLIRLRDHKCTSCGIELEFGKQGVSVRWVFRCWENSGSTFIHPHVHSTQIVRNFSILLTSRPVTNVPVSFWQDGHRCNISISIQRSQSTRGTQKVVCTNTSDSDDFYHKRQPH